MSLFNYDGNGSIRVGALKVSAQRWPWQKGYGWRGMTNSSAPLNSGGARFGGGWNFKLGIAVGGSTIILDLIFGMIRLSFETDKDRAAAAELRAWQERRRAESAYAREPF